MKLPNNNFNHNPISGSLLLLRKQTDGRVDMAKLTGAQKNAKVPINILEFKILAAHTWVPLLSVLSSNKRAPWNKGTISEAEIPHYYGTRRFTAVVIFFSHCHHAFCKPCPF